MLATQEAAEDVQGADLFGCASSCESPCIGSWLIKL